MGKLVWSLSAYVRGQGEVVVTSKTTLIFPTSVEEAFEHLVYSKDCQNWMHGDDLHGLLYLMEGTDLCGIEVSNPTDGVAPITMPLKLEKNRRAVYGPVIPNQDNVEPRKKGSFPFKEMHIVIEFGEHSEGCEVQFAISLAPSGLLGWFLCKFLVAPYAIRSSKRKNQALVRYLEPSKKGLPD